MKLLTLVLILSYNFCYSQSYRKISPTGEDITNLGPIPRSTDGKFLYNHPIKLIEDSTKIKTVNGKKTLLKKEEQDILLEEENLKKP